MFKNNTSVYFVVVMISEVLSKIMSLVLYFV